MRVPRKRLHLGLVIGVEEGLGGEVEVGSAVEVFEHRHEGVDGRYHVDEFVNLYVEQVEVESHEEVAGSWRLVDGRELHGGGLADEAYLVEHRRAVLDGDGAGHVVEVVVEGYAAFDMCVQRHVDILGHYERVGVLGYVVFLAHLLDGVFVGADAADEVEELVDVGVA